MRGHRWCLALLLAAATAARGGGVRDVDDAWLVSSPALTRLLAPQRPIASRWQASLITGRLYGLAELPQNGISLAVTRNALRAELNWQRLGSTLLRQDAWRVGLMAGRRWRIGLEAGEDRQRVLGAADQHAPALAGRIHGRAGAHLHLDLWLHLQPPPPWFAGMGLRRWARLEADAAGWGWAVVVDRAGDGHPFVQGEAMLVLGPSAALGLRVDPHTGALGLCTAWSIGRIMLRTAHLAHPQLGTTHRWALVVGTGRAPEGR